ncbi:hypothetical protein [Cupriavidus plantarum]|uniref:hypothetical protein n=1 Tax=Cupriavidus plantarum TaxID=942865 RepID=UPI001C62C138|nr:hypothetical protein [Cupriavidus plantarum]
MGALMPDLLRVTVTAEAEAVLGEPAALMADIDAAWRVGLAARKTAMRQRSGMIG